MKKYIDSHCHLPKSGNFQDVFARANAGGIVGCVLNAVTEYDWLQIVNTMSANCVKTDSVDCINTYSRTAYSAPAQNNNKEAGCVNLLCADDTLAHNKKEAGCIDVRTRSTNATSKQKVAGCIGIHPWYADTASANWTADMSALLESNPTLMVGEVGVDKTRDDIDIQERVFTQCLELAIKYNRVLNLHCVRAWDIVLRVLKSYKKQLPKIVVHSFDGTEKAINFDEKLYFSYSPTVAKPNYKKTRLSVCKVPKNKILLESDSADLLPVLDTANAIFALRPDITADDIYNNSLGVFFNG